MREGWKNYNIRKELDISSFDFNIYIKDIKNKKIMTSEEINLAREKKRQADLQFVADSVKRGLTLTQIRELKPEFSYNEPTAIIKELIKTGIITQEEVDENARKGVSNTMNKNVELSSDEQIKFVLEKVKEGYKPSEIVESDETKSLTIHKVLYQKRKLIEKGIITEEEANQAMQKRQNELLEKKHKNIIDEIKHYTELGYTLLEISKFITEYKYEYLCKIKNTYAKNNGWYEKEELKSFADARKAREIEETQRIFDSLPLEEKEKIEEEKKAEAERKEKEKRKTQEEIIAKRQARKDRTKNKYQDDLIILKEHLKSGKTMKQIAEAMGVSISYLYKLREEGINSKNWLTEEELNGISEIKKAETDEEKKKREKQKIKEKNKKYKEEKLRVKKEVEKLKEYIKSGYTYQEISEIMCYSVSNLQNLKRLAIKDNIWFTKEEIKEFKRLRKARETLETEEAQKKDQEMIERENREEKNLIRKEEKNRENLEKERIRKIEGYSKEYKVYKKAAKKEDKMEQNGGENVPTDGRIKLIEILTKLNNLDTLISEQDIEIVLNTLYLYPKLANKNNINLLISQANKKGGIKAALLMTNELIDTLRYTRFYKPLVEYGSWIRKKALFPRIQDMKNKGMSYEYIGEKLGISSTEVRIIFHKNEIPSFEDYNER